MTRFVALLLAGAMSGVLPSIAPAQSVSGSITGTVRDAQGAVVPRAAVSVRNTETGRALNAASNGSGVYQVAPVDAGTYVVSAVVPGFKEVAVTGVRVDVSSTVRVDLNLQVGAVQESVTVEASGATLVQTDSSTLESTVENKQILELPLDGRNVNDLVYLTSGTIRNDSLPGLGDYSADGNRPHSNNFLVDGVANRDEFRGQTGVGVSVDAVREFKIKKSTASAEFGGGSSSLVLALKSGTNQWHGSAYEYNRNRLGRARDFFDTTSDIPKFLRNQFGASLGGPVRRNRTFFFASYEGTRIRSSTTRLFSVPTEAMRSGDFRGAVGAQGQAITLKQPSVLPFQLAAGQPLFSAPNVINPFYLADSAGNPNRVNSRIAKAVLGLYAPANLPGQYNNLSANLAQAQGGENLTARMDHTLTGKHNLSGRMTVTLPRQYFAANPRAPSIGVLPDNLGLSAGVAVVSVLSPSVVNEASLGWQNFRERYLPSPASNFIEENGIRMPYAPLVPIERMPAFAFAGNGIFDLLSYSVATNDAVPRLLQTKSYPVNETLTWQKGRQLIKAGVQLRMLAMNASSDQYPAGLLTFNGNTGVRFSGYSVADLLLGVVYSSRFALLPPPSEYRTLQKAGFIQVDRQAGQRLTLNLGLRWEQRPPVTEASNVIAAFDPSLGKIVVASPSGEISKTAYPALVEQYKNLIVTATTAGWQERRLSNTDNNNWAPRVGFALRLDRSGRTVVRSAYGVFYSYYPFQQAVLMSQIVPFALISQTTSPANDPMTIANPFRVVSAALTFKGFEKNFRDGYNQQWNFGIERVLGKSNLLDLTYVGNKGVHLPSDTPLTAAGFNNLRVVSSRGNSTYHALQAEIRRRYGKGFFYQANWTWAKSLDDHMVGVNTEMQLFSSSLRLNRGDSPFVRRHVLRGNFLYQLPVGRRQRFGSGWNRAADAVLGGWSFGGISSFSTGGFLTAVVQGGLFSTRPDRVLGVPIRLTDADRQRLAAETGDASYLDRTKRWFNPFAFRTVDADAGRFGNSGRNIIVGPASFNLDGVLSKSFAVTEKARLTLRIEAFNVTNRTNFSMGAAGNTPLNVVINSPNAGAFSRTSGNPRQFQFALRVDF